MRAEEIHGMKQSHSEVTEQTVMMNWGSWGAQMKEHLATSVGLDVTKGKENSWRVSSRGCPGESIM